MYSALQHYLQAVQIEQVHGSVTWEVRKVTPSEAYRHFYWKKCSCSYQLVHTLPFQSQVTVILLILCNLIHKHKNDAVFPSSLLTFNCRVDWPPVLVLPMARQCSLLLLISTKSKARASQEDCSLHRSLCKFQPFQKPWSSLPAPRFCRC